MSQISGQVVFKFFRRLLKVMDKSAVIQASGYYYAAYKRRRRQSVEYGVPIPHGMALSVTANCNFSCPGCPSTVSDPHRRELNSTELEGLILQAKSLGLHLFLIIGGEPFTRDDLLDLIVREQDAFFIVFTNGSLLDEKIASTLGDCRNVLVLLSIEGFQEATDRWRGPGTFNMLMNKMALLSRHGVFFGFSSTVTTLNQEEVTSGRFASAMKDAGCRVGFYSSYMTVGDQAPCEYQLSADEGVVFRERLEARQKAGGMAFISENLENHCCLGGSEFLHISPYGDAEPCPAIHFSTHNVREHSLVDIIKSPVMRNMRQIAESLAGEKESCVCKSGDYSKLCTGVPQAAGQTGRTLSCE